MERLGDDAHRLLAGAGLPEGDLLVRIARAWPSAVGEAVARAAWPARLGRDRTLHVATVSSTWAFELDRLGPQISERLHASLGADAPAALRFAPGPVPEPPARRAPAAAPEPARPGAEEAAEAAGAAAAISDEELRELAFRAAAASLSRQRSGRRFW
jgi:hypothetical protein